MGFFNKLFDTINENKDKIESVVKAVESVLESNASPAEHERMNNAPYDSGKEQTGSTTSDSNPYAFTYNTDDRYFASIITPGSFPGYSMDSNVHARTLDASAHPRCYPISYMFSKNGQPVLAVLIMNKNQYRSMIARGTYKVLDNKGIKYIRFYKGMENKQNYVLNRIRENLI